MINISNNQLIYVTCFVLITLVCAYFLLVWQIREIVKDELVKENETNNYIKNKDKRKKLMYLKQKRMQQAHVQNGKKQDSNQSVGTFDDFSDNIDLDSYVDPAVGYYSREQADNENDANVIGYSGGRLDKNDIMARDIADGLR